MNINGILCAVFMIIPILSFRKEIKSVFITLMGRIRRLGVQTVFIYGLAASVLLTLALTTAGRMHYEQDTFLPALFTGLETTFNLLEGNSTDFRDLLSPKQWLKCFSYFLSAAVPFFTTGTVLTLILHHFPMPAPLGKTYYIFSDLDNRSILLARDIADHAGDPVFLFMRTDRDDVDPELLSRLIGLHYTLYPYSEDVLLSRHWLLRYRSLRFFFMSENTDENFRRMHVFLTAVSDKRLFRNSHLHRDDDWEADAEKSIYRQELYLLSETETAPMLIDRLRKSMCEGTREDFRRKDVFQWTELRLLDRYRALSYQLLQQVPLYETANGKHNRILILGFGRVGQALFRTALSFSAMVGYTTCFTISDREIDRKYDAMKQVYRECGEGYKVLPETIDAESPELEAHLKEQTDPYTLIYICLGDDERNIRTATRLKRYYRKMYWENKNVPQPVICVNVEDEIKSEYTGHLFDEPHKKWNRHLKTFGTDTERFSVEALLPRSQWAAAQSLHKILKGKKTWLVPFWDEYQRRSSMAGVCHAAFHVASVSPDCDCLDERYPSLYEENKKALTDAEHCRWTDYVRTEGMQEALLEAVVKYHGELNDGHLDVVGQLTPCLTAANNLDSLYSQLLVKELLKENTRPFREKDALAVEHALEFSQMLHRADS